MDEINNNIVESKNEILDSLDNSSKKEDSKKDDNRAGNDQNIDFKLDSLTLSKSNIINILEDLRVIKKRYSHIENILKEAERAQYRPSRDLPGIVGIFDGEFMVTTDGQKLEVPKNYAAKSLLVYGDELKRMVDEEGKEAFKILNKVPRKKIEGLLSKKDGRYVILADAGTFNLSKNAVEFRNIKQGEWILAVIPETGQTGNFAAIDKVIIKEKQKDVKFFEPKKKENRDLRPSDRSNNQKKQESRSHESKPKPQMTELKEEIKPQAPKIEQAPKQSPMPKIEFSDDDLV